MAQVKKTVGVYERPEKRTGVRVALVAAAVILAAAGGAAVFFL
jgi:hypothetical protein